ncbi:hypothetical protein DMENIID0001_067280 [Sergentomyia squamirostris]
MEKPVHTEQPVYTEQPVHTVTMIITDTISITGIMILRQQHFTATPTMEEEEEGATQGITNDSIPSRKC